MQEIILEKQLPVVKINFEEVKASLIAGAEKYKGLVVSEEGLKDCKATQKDLASTRIKLDNYRKEIKKEMLKPIDTFESQCKELIALVVEVENPIKEGIALFDKKKKDANREMAEKIIAEFVKEEGLIKKYADQLQVIDKYMNLTAKENEVTADIQQRGYLLLQQQNTEIETLQIINDTIVNLNKNIDAKLSIEDFQSLIDTNTSPVKIMAEINARAERIKANEEKAVTDKAARAEKEVQERIAKAEREAAEKTRIEEREKLRLKVIADAEIEMSKKLQEINLPKEPVKEEIQWVGVGGVPVSPEVNKMANETIKEKLYFIDMKVSNITIEQVRALSQFLKDNNYNYEVNEKGLM